MRFTPMSMTTVPSFTISAVTVFGYPVTTTRMSACWVKWARSVVPVWQMVTVALAASPFWERMLAKGLPTSVLRPTMTTCLPATLKLPRLRMCCTPCGVQGKKPSSPRIRRPRFTGCRPSTSFSGEMALRVFCSSKPLGNGNWTRMP